MVAVHIISDTRPDCKGSRGCSSILFHSERPNSLYFITFPHLFRANRFTIFPADIIIRIDYPPFGGRNEVGYAVP